MSTPDLMPPILKVFASRIVPESAALDAAGRARFHAIVAEALAERPSGVQRQFRTFLSLLRLTPLLRFGATFERLAPERQDAVLRWFQDDAPSLLRKGLWGLKTIVFMGYYAQTQVTESLSYTPTFSGNEKLHA